jgi:hypothetical protein
MKSYLKAERMAHGAWYMALGAWSWRGDELEWLASLSQSWFHCGTQPQTWEYFDGRDETRREGRNDGDT